MYAPGPRFYGAKITVKQNRLLTSHLWWQQAWLRGSLHLVDIRVKILGQDQKVVRRASLDLLDTDAIMVFDVELSYAWVVFAD